MAKGPENAASRLSALVTEIEAEAYARGRADARKEILTALGAAGEPASRPRRGKAPATRSASKPRTSGGKRAPRGMVRALVERVLHDRPGLTAKEILDCAATDAERLVKLTSIRVELHTGRRQNRYDSRDGRWSLAASSSAVEEGEPNTPKAPAADVSTVPPEEASPSETGPSREAGEPPSAPTGDAEDGNASSGKLETGGGKARLGMNW